MRYLSHPEIRRRLSVSVPVLVACLALPAAASAQSKGLERAARGVDDGSAGIAPKPFSPVTVESVSGAPGEAIPLAVTVSAKPGQPVSNTYLVGLPKGARLADAEHTVTATDEKAAIDVTHWDLPRLSVMLPPTQAGTYTLAVVAVSRPDNGEPMNFTSSTFTLKATTESREAGSAPGTKRPDAPVLREALLPPSAAPPSTTALSDTSVQAGGIAPRITSPVTEVFVPEAPANLRRERGPRANTVPNAVARPSPSDLRTAELRPAPALAAPPALAARPTLGPPTTSPSTTSPAATLPAPAPPAPAAEVDGKALLERAERLIRLGDISGARLVLERAADRGDPRATFLLAQTCDPRMLREWKVQGLKPDPDRARALYAKAAQEGLRETKPVTDAGR